MMEKIKILSTPKKEMRKENETNFIPLAFAPRLKCPRTVSASQKVENHVRIVRKIGQIIEKNKNKLEMNKLSTEN